MEGGGVIRHTAARIDARPLGSAAEVHGYVRRICFKTGPPSTVGAELEWMVARTADPHAVVTLAELADAVDPALLQGGSSFTLEPGGQVELSSAPAATLSALHRDLGDDVATLTRSLRAARLSLVPTASDPHRSPRRLLHTPRYDAMEAYFATLPHDLGPAMMCSTAAVQVNLDIGADEGELSRRWRLLEALGPVLVAAFANSPHRAGAPTGWKSTRQAIWQGLEPRRTHAPVGEDPAAAWADFALAAPVMAVRSAAGPWLAAPGWSFGDWLEGRVSGVARPTEDDLAFHLTTLFPPVRPRGWFEVRYVDAQAPRWWPVPVVLLATAVDDGSLHSELLEVCAPTRGRWLGAARSGLADPVVGHAARRVFELLLPRVPDATLRMLAERFHETYVDRGRCPADDHLHPEPVRLPSRPAHPTTAEEPRR